MKKKACKVTQTIAHKKRLVNFDLITVNTQLKILNEETKCLWFIKKLCIMYILLITPLTIVKRSAAFQPVKRIHWGIALSFLFYILRE